MDLHPGRHRPADRDWLAIYCAVWLIGCVSFARAQERGTQGDRHKFLEPVKNPVVVPPADAKSELFLSRDGGNELDPIFRIYGDYPSVSGSLGRKMGNRRDPAFKDPEGKVVAMEVLRNGDVLFGPNLGIARRPKKQSDPKSRLETDPQHSSPIDFYWDAADRKLHVRSILLTENGDPADLAFRRAGDETYPYGPPQAVTKGMNLGTMYWMGWGADDYGFDDRAAAISAKAAENITSKGAGGSLHFATTPLGSTKPTERLVISSEGDIGIGTPAPAAALHVAPQTGSGIAEDYPASEPLEPGDVVAIDEAAQSLSVVRARNPYDQKIVGVVAASPAMRISRRNPAAVEDQAANAILSGYPVAHGGRVTVKVNAENGAIRPGDYLTSSSTPGVAMKATAKGAVVGKALQAHAQDGAGKIEMLMDVTWYQP